MTPGDTALGSLCNGETGQGFDLTRSSWGDYFFCSFSILALRYQVSSLGLSRGIAVE